MAENKIKVPYGGFYVDGLQIMKNNTVGIGFFEVKISRGRDGYVSDMSSEEIIKKFDETGAIPWCLQPANITTIEYLYEIDRENNTVVLAAPARINDSKRHLSLFSQIKITGNVVGHYNGPMLYIPAYGWRSDASINQEVVIDLTDYKLYTNPYNIYTSPNGTKYKVVVSDDGTLSTEKITS